MNTKIFDAMMEFFRNDPKQIQHFTKVYTYAKLIGLEEKLDEKTQYILEAAAIMHDIGIRISEEKHGKGICDGPKQELYGPPAAEEMLRSLGEKQEVIDRVSYLVGHHHTYTDIDGSDYQILVEADFLVNLYEGNSSKEVIDSVYHRIFRTETGKRMMRTMFAAE